MYFIHQFVSDRLTGEIRQQGESVQFWKEKISTIASLVKLWDIAQSDYSTTDYIKWSENGISIFIQGNWKDIVSPGLGNMHLLSRWQKRDIKEPILMYISIEMGTGWKSYADFADQFVGTIKYPGLKVLPNIQTILQKIEPL